AFPLLDSLSAIRHLISRTSPKNPPCYCSWWAAWQWLDRRRCTRLDRWPGTRQKLQLLWNVTFNNTSFTKSLLAQFLKLCFTNSEGQLFRSTKEETAKLTCNSRLLPPLSPLPFQFQHLNH